MIKGYDIIGDIHGELAKLTGLLEAMEYRFEDGCYRHPERKAIFVGDFIDRGPNQRGVLELVMAMTRCGAALAVMGNHEYNALAFHTRDPERPATWLRPRNDKNIVLHMAFLREYLLESNDAPLQEVLQFFKSLPLWLELDGLRVVHACWDFASVRNIQVYLDHNGCLTDHGLVATCRSGSVAAKALELLLKGPELRLPKGAAVTNSKGVKRDMFRLKWWNNHVETLSDLLVKAAGEAEFLARPASVEIGYPEGEKPVFFGHYWFSGTPSCIAHNIACLDYSAASRGPLVAYRWSGEATLTDEHLFWLTN